MPLLNNYVKVNGVIYSKNTLVVIDNTDVHKIFGRITRVIREKDVISFEMQEYEDAYFDNHTHCYRIIKRNKITTKKLSELFDFPPCIIIKKRKKKC